MVLVIGATGLVGSEVCLRLRRRGESVRALVRSTSAPEKVARLRDAGVETVLGDLKDPASLALACKGIDAIISTASCTFSRGEGDSIQTIDHDGQLALVDAAKQAGIDRFVFLSFRHSPAFPFPLADAKAAVEAALQEFDHTVIQASYFMEVHLSPALGFDPVHGTARVYGNGDGPISWVSSSDVAEMCAVALRSPAASRRTLAFGGPEALTHPQVIARFEKLGGKPFTVEHIPADSLFAQFTAATDPLQKSFAALALGYMQGDAMDMAPLQREFGLHLTSLDDYARKALATA